METRNGLVVPGLLCGAAGLAAGRIDALFVGACVLGGAAILLGFGGRGSAGRLGGDGKIRATLALLLGIATLVTATIGHGTAERLADSVGSEARKASEDVEHKGDRLEAQTGRTRRDIDKLERDAASP